MGRREGEGGEGRHHHALYETWTGAGQDREQVTRERNRSLKEWQELWSSAENKRQGQRIFKGG